MDTNAHETLNKWFLSTMDLRTTWHKVVLCYSWQMKLMYLHNVWVYPTTNEFPDFAYL